MKGFGYEKDAAGIVTLTMDMHGPVNAMNVDFLDGMEHFLEQLEADEGVIGVVLASGKETFFAGADLNELSISVKGYEEEAFRHVSRGTAVMRRLEKLPVPVVAAINGAALGGGYELCLACNHRIAWDTPGTVVGLPEVTFGLMPGGGGTVRLTKLFGLEKALPYLLGGTVEGVADALNSGLIDQSVSEKADLVPAARTWIRANQDDPDASLQPWDRRGFQIPGGDLNTPAIVSLASQAPFAVWKETLGLMPNKTRVLDCAVEALKWDIDTALRYEGRSFINLLLSPITNNVLTANFFDKRAIKKGVSRPSDIPRQKLDRLGVISSGATGHKLVAAAAKANVAVAYFDPSPANGANTSLAAEFNWERTSETAGQVTIAGSLEDFATCDLVIETLGENTELKRQIAKEIEQRLPPETVYASAGSIQPLADIADVLSSPERGVGLQVFADGPSGELVEIARRSDTSDFAVALVFDFFRGLGKSPIIVNEAPGLFVTRVIEAQAREGAQLAAEGVEPIRIENLAKFLGLRTGPLALQDAVGLRLSERLSSAQSALGQSPDSDPTPEGRALLSELVRSGRSGRTNGGGFYDYSTAAPALNPSVLEPYTSKAGILPDADIKDRILFSGVIAAIEAFEDGTVNSVPEGNFASLVGAGAPAWTGGYIQFVNGHGLETFAARCAELASAYGDRFQAPRIVRQKIANKETFA